MIGKRSALLGKLRIKPAWSPLRLALGKHTRIAIVGVWAVASLVCYVSFANELLTATPADFLSFYYASKALVLGHSAYDRLFLQGLARNDGIGAYVFPYLYPPIFAVLLRPMTQISVATAHKLWIFGIAGVAGALAALVIYFDAFFAKRCFKSDKGPRLGARRSLTSILALAMLIVHIVPVRNNIAIGQTNLFLVAILGWANVAYLQRRRGLSGALAAAVASVKLTPALLLLFFAARRSRRSIVGFVAGASGIMVVTLLLGGLRPWQEYLEFLNQLGPYGSKIPGLFPLATVWNFSPMGSLARVFPREPSVVLLVGTAISLVVVASATLAAARARDEVAVAFAFAVFCLAPILVSSFTYLHHVVFVGPAAALWLTWAIRLERSALFLSLVALLAIAGLNWPDFYDLIGGPFRTWPALRAVNLYALLALYCVGLVLVFRRGLGYREPGAATP